MSRLIGTPLTSIPPGITAQPAIQIVTPGATATFNVTAIGTPPLSYQWRFNGSDLQDKTNRTLSIANVQSINAGRYFVVVSNAFGSVMSQEAGLAFTARLSTCRRANSNRWLQEGVYHRRAIRRHRRLRSRIWNISKPGFPPTEEGRFAGVHASTGAMPACRSRSDLHFGDGTEELAGGA